jgi:hypothetical protein
MLSLLLPIDCWLHTLDAREQAGTIIPAAFILAVISTGVPFLLHTTAKYNNEIITLHTVPSA